MNEGTIALLGLLIFAALVAAILLFRRSDAEEFAEEVELGRDESNVYVTGAGQRLVGVHAPGTCLGPFCVIHRPSHHHMREWPTYWRQDLGIMERICPHGIGHPDPDDMAFHSIRAHKLAHAQGDEMYEARGRDIANDYVDGLGIHSCDGCCADEGPKTTMPPEGV